MKATFTSGIRCNFMLMLSKCDLVTNIPSIPTTDVDFRIRFDFLAYLFYILSVCVSFLGLASNLLITVAVSHKDNSKVLKEQTHFHYMRLNAVFNSIIFVIQVFGLMSECTKYCSLLHRLIGIQLEKIIFSEFLMNVFRYMTSLSYIAFTLSRISLLGKEHGKIVTWVSEVNMKKFISISMILSLLFCAVKVFSISQC